MQLQLFALYHSLVHKMPGFTWCKRRPLQSSHKYNYKVEQQVANKIGNARDPKTPRGIKHLVVDQSDRPIKVPVLKFAREQRIDSDRSHGMCQITSSVCLGLVEVLIKSFKWDSNVQYGIEHYDANWTHQL